MTKPTMPQPPGIRPECFADENLCVRYGQVVSAYDPESQVGGMFNLTTREWALFYPITPDKFAARVATAVRVTEAQIPEPIPATIN